VVRGAAATAGKGTSCSSSAASDFVVASSFFLLSSDSDILLQSDEDRYDQALNLLLSCELRGIIVLK
jgi:hypothetical protein